MTHYAGQMLPWGHGAAISPFWVLANGRFYRAALAGDYHKRHGFRPGIGGIYLLRTPPGPLTGMARWLVLLRDDPTQPDLPPDTPTASRPPTSAAAQIVIGSPSGGSQASPVTVSGVTTAGTQLQAAQNNAGVIGAFTGLTVTGTTFSGTVVMTPGASQRIRVRQVGATYNYTDSNLFTVTGAAEDELPRPHRRPR